MRLSYELRTAQTDADAVKAAVDLVPIVERDVSLRRSGRRLVGLCPFHAEKTPSFAVNPETQHWWCFGCGRGGDVFSYVMERDGLDFRSALSVLAADRLLLPPMPVAARARQALAPPDLRPIVAAAGRSTPLDDLRRHAELLRLPPDAGVQALLRLGAHLPNYDETELLRLLPRDGDGKAALRWQLRVLSRERGAWLAFPMSAHNRVVGVRLRRSDGTKRALAGGREGLFAPADMHREPGLLVFVEGPTDASALLAVGLEAVGRPSCTGAVEQALRLVLTSRSRGVAVLLDRDQPGITGGLQLARHLGPIVGDVRVALPPRGFKDAREAVGAGATAADFLATIEGGHRA